MPKPTPTAEELQQRAKETAIAMGWEKPEPEAPPVVAAPVAPVIPPVVPPVPKVAAPVTPPEEREPSTQEIIDRTARATAMAMRVEPTAAPAVPPLDLLPEDAQTHQVLLYLEGTDAKYRGKAAEYLDYTKKHYAYQDKWQAANPDKQFDGSEDEHREWYAANQPHVTDKEIEEGALQMKIDQAAERKYQQMIAPEKAAQEAARAWDAALPNVSLNVNRRIILLVEASRPELAAMLRTAEGAPNLTDETITAVDTADPIAKEIFDELVNDRLAPMLIELEKSAIPALHSPLDPQRNAVHAQIDRYRAQAERDIQQLPAVEQTREGRQFTTISQMNRLREAIESGGGTKEERAQKLADLRSSRWSLTVDDLQDVITDDLAREAGQKIEKRDASARKKYAGGQPAPQPAAQPAAHPASAPARPASGKPSPPSFSTGSDVVTSGKTGSAAPKSFGEQAAEVMFK